MYRKRLLVCTLGGVLSAIFCLVGKQIIYGFPEITWGVLATTMANRILLGFIIGISCWRINYLLHGAILGLIVSLSVSIGFLPDKILGFFLYTPAGIAYGIMIEWLATVVFKSPMRAPQSSWIKPAVRCQRYITLKNCFSKLVTSPSKVFEVRKMLGYFCISAKFRYLGFSQYITTCRNP